MKFIIFSKAQIQDYPLVLSLVYVTQELGYDVEIVTQNIAPKLKEELEVRNFKVHSIENKNSSNKVQKLVHWYKFSKFAKGIYEKTPSDAKIWITGSDTAICMGVKTLQKRAFYFQINELYDQLPHYLKRIRKITQIAKEIITPERNRAAMFQVWFSLKKMPFVLPNQPFFQDNLISQGIKENEKHISFLKEAKDKGKKIFLYQGHLGADRDFSALLKVVRKKENVQTVLMGQDHGVLEGYMKIDPSIYYIPPIPAPFHLNITQLSDIGMLLYLPVSLNNIYCAPNKIWEYARYGLALVGNDIVGLDCITDKKMGVQCDISIEEDVERKFDILLSEIDLCKSNSLKFYENSDFKTNVQNILKN